MIDQEKLFLFFSESGLHHHPHLVHWKSCLKLSASNSPIIQTRTLSTFFLLFSESPLKPNRGNPWQWEICFSGESD